MSVNKKSIENLKKGNPGKCFQKDDPKTKAAGEKGREAQKQYKLFREKYKESILNDDSRQDRVIEALQKKAEEGDVQAIRLLLDMLGETKIASDLVSDNKIEIILGDMGNWV